MSFKINIPGQNASLALPLNIGEVLLLLGANGSGKSAIIDKIYKDHRENVKKIAATRQNWFQTGKLNMTQKSRDEYGNYFEDWDRQQTSRYFETNSSERVDLTLFDLITAVNTRARRIAIAVDSAVNYLNDDKNKEATNIARRNPSIVAQINQLLASSNMPIEISIGQGDQILASKNSGDPFDIAALSDGERNTLIIATMILTAPPETFILIDEPERHLHRSIIVPLIKALITMRSDCAFVIATHELALPLEVKTPHVLVVRDCAFANNEAGSWDFDYMPVVAVESENLDDIYEDLHRDMLGSRRRVLFVEGKSDSLDRPLYSLIFPGVSVISKSGCREVERAVTGLRSLSTSYHWIKAFGIIDEDRRDATTVEKLKEKGIYAIRAYSVESIYYHPQIQRLAVASLCRTTGDCPDSALADAKSSAIKALADNKERLCKRAIEKTIRALVEQQMPTIEHINSGGVYSVNIPIDDRLNEEKRLFDEFMTNANLESLIARYPIRETPAINQICRSLKFAGRQQYESTVREIISKDETALKFVRSLFGSLYEDIHDKE